MNFHHYIRSQQESTNLAVIEQRREWTYEEFAQHVLHFQDYFVAKQVKKVMVCLPQGFYAYAVIWGAYLAGSTFCPVTEGVPGDRKAYYAELFQPVVIINNGNENITGHTNIAVTGILSEKYRSTEDKNESINPDFNAYVIFTSGSTGLPKGVMVPRKALENFLQWSTGEYNVSAGDRWGQFSNLGFDLSLCDIFTAILKEATLVPVAGKAEKLFPGKLIAKRGITFWHSVPSVIDVLHKAGHITAEVLGNVKTMTFCGETLYASQLSLLFNANPDLVIYNTYGPTESTIFCSYVKLTKDNFKAFGTTTISIGKALPGYRLSLSSETENLNEIIISGDYIASGYIAAGSNEKTAQPFTSLSIDGVACASYFSGDYGEIKDGHLYFAGRKDSQVKINGHRVDLSEIDHWLREYGCKASTTTCLQNKIVSFLIADDYAEAVVREYLSAKLPDYYLPALIVAKDHFPYNANGKIDIKELLKEIDSKF